MAMNPEWCQPISKWKEYFNSWITEAKPQDLMEVSIFFDFRCLYGDVRFTRELREDIAMKVANRDAFFYQLAQNALLFRLPLDFFGNIAVESSGDNPDTFNIKNVIALVVGYARIYAINFALDDTNTLQRLDLLRDKDFIGKDTHEEISEAYNYLMQVRFKHQVTMMNKGLKPDNHIRLEELNYMEKSVLKKIFSQVGNLQKQLSAIGKVEIFF
jgi:CBS domain-containing protein